LIRYGVISEEEARTRILETVNPLDERAVPLAGALDCFAAQDYFARLPLPAFDNSAMDGYAVVASSCKKGGLLRVIGEQPAGPDRKLRVSDGEAVRIFTGAPVPQGADAIVMQEDVTPEGTDISVDVNVESGEFLRQRGCDLAAGQIILARGERIRAATMALLASQGFADVMVGGQPTAAVISTGDELVKSGEDLRRAFVEAAQFGPAVDRFFTEIFVMVEDPALRKARLRLMKVLERLILRIADISEIVSETE